MKDLVSIIMPTYNSSRFVAESIESILRQSYSNFELLITDDVSTDNTFEILKSYAQKDNRIKFFALTATWVQAMQETNLYRKLKVGILRSVTAMTLGCLTN